MYLGASRRVNSALSGRGASAFTRRATVQCLGQDTTSRHRRKYGNITKFAGSPSALMLAPRPRPFRPAFSPELVLPVPATVTRRRGQTGREGSNVLLQNNPGTRSLVP